MYKKTFNTTKGFVEKFQSIEDERKDTFKNSNQLSNLLTLITDNTKLISKMEVPAKTDEDFIMALEISLVVQSLSYKDRALFFDKLTILNPKLGEFIFNHNDFPEKYLSGSDKIKGTEVDNIEEFYEKVDGDNVKYKFITKFSLIQSNTSNIIKDTPTLEKLMSLLSDNKDMIKSLPNPNNMGLPNEDITISVLIRTVMNALEPKQREVFLNTLNQLNSNLSDYLKLGAIDSEKTKFEISNMDKFTTKDESWLFDLYSGYNTTKNLVGIGIEAAVLDINKEKSKALTIYKDKKSDAITKPAEQVAQVPIKKHFEEDNDLVYNYFISEDNRETLVCMFGDTPIKDVAPTLETTKNKLKKETVKNTTQVNKKDI